MDSINKNQEEENHKDLQGTEAGKKIMELAGKSKTCFFCTGITSGKPVTVRPMSVQKMDEFGSLWFLSASDSHKNLDIARDNRVQLFFQGSAHSDFLSVYGEAAISTDKQLIKELWEPILKAWFTEGVDDPRITVIKVDVQEGYYWDNKHGNAIALMKIAAGAVMGKTMDDSIEGNLKV
ncbi:MAG TPA: pyridoxamine 5'-phosphate oxidase family protein [Hanamia sp.]|nr:pyridoxamine 5'-phosphate oxidase family protein [Hanamia sp.]